MYGLGVCDMKAGVAAMILATRFLCEAGFPPQGDVIIQSVVDEEGGGNGTLGCVVEGYKADAAIVTEPTRLHVQPASRGVLLLEVDVEGRATHACLEVGRRQRDRKGDEDHPGDDRAGTAVAGGAAQPALPAADHHHRPDQRRPGRVAGAGRVRAEVRRQVSPCRDGPQRPRQAERRRYGESGSRGVDPHALRRGCLAARTIRRR